MTSRPRAASSLAVTGPPPPAPTTITSTAMACSSPGSLRCRAAQHSFRHLRDAAQIPLELIPSLNGPLIRRQRHVLGEFPADRCGGQSIRGGVEYAKFVVT